MSSPFSGRAGRLAGIRGTELAVQHYNAGNDLINQARGQTLDLLGQGRTNALTALDGGLAAARPEFAGAINRFEPWAEAGRGALGTLQNSLGQNGAEGNAAAVSQFQASPGYQYQVDQASDAIARKGSALGALGSGNTMAAISDRAGQMANQEYGGWQDRLTGLSQTGLQATGQQAGLQAQLGGLEDGAGRDAAGIYTGTAGQEAGAIQGFAGQGLANLGRMSESVIGSETGALLAGQTAAQNKMNFGTSLLSLGATLGGSYFGGMPRKAA